MDDDFEILGLTKDASESEIRQRYLELVREFSPERAPERFAAIHGAYSALRDPTARLESQLFRYGSESDSFDKLASDLRQRLRRVRLPVDSLLSLADSP
jgi:curved DNA-binding protein CbpA